MTLWWPICPGHDYFCGDAQYKAYLERQEAIYNPQTVLHSVNTINMSSENIAPNRNTVNYSDAKIVTPSITFFQTEYARAVNLNGKVQEVIISYNTMSSLSIGSKLSGLDHKPEIQKTVTLPIKTLYYVNRKSFDVLHIKLKRHKAIPFLKPHEKN